MKATCEELLDEIAADLNVYLMSGNIYDLTSFSKKIDPSLNIDNIEKLLRIHFVLTQSTDSNVGVIDFIERLSQRLRRVKTTVRREPENLEGEVRGKVRWKDTIMQRCNRNPEDYTLFVCDRSERNYDIPENLVLKSLLQIVHKTIYEDLAIAFENEYEWLKQWSREKELKSTLNNLFLRNVYLKRIDLTNIIVTDRMISRAGNSRLALYRDAASLLSRYRRLMNYELDAAEARDLLTNTFIRPEATSVLFELYWTIKIIKQFEQFGDVKFQLLEPGSRMVALWEDNEYKYSIYHDSTGSFQFSEGTEGLGDMLKDSNNYLGRELKVLSKLEQLVGVPQDLWGGRPDIVLEKYTKDNHLVSVLVGEVKYTNNRAYAIQGLKELLEYMALIRDRGAYIEGYDNLFGKLQKVKGCLFIDNITEPLWGDKEVQVVTFRDNVRINLL